MNKQQILEKFNKQLQIENYSKQTVRNYLSTPKLFLEFISKINTKKVSDDDIQNYLFYCKTKKEYSYSTMKQVIGAISYAYVEIINEPIPKTLDIKLRKLTHLPTVLSVKDISKILTVTSNLKHKTILILLYSGGLRLGELLNLKIGDIDSEEIKIHVRQGKGDGY